MPKPMTTGAAAPDEMDELYQGDNEAQGGAQGASVDEQRAEAGGKTGLVPVSVLQSSKGEAVKVGDEIVVKVTKIEGDQAVIEYAPEKPGGDEEAGETPGAEGREQTPDEEIDAMDKY